MKFSTTAASLCPFSKKRRTRSDVHPLAEVALAVEFTAQPLAGSDPVKFGQVAEIGVPARRIGEILAGRRAVTADTDLRLCRFFGLSDDW